VSQSSIESSSPAAAVTVEREEGYRGSTAKQQSEEETSGSIYWRSLEVKEGDRLLLLLDSTTIIAVTSN
jgi:hypothetical protein